MPQPAAGAHRHAAGGKCRPGGGGEGCPGAGGGGVAGGGGLQPWRGCRPWLTAPRSLQETDQLEEEKSALQAEIANLLKEKEKLEFILAAHRPACKMPEELRFSEELVAATALDLGSPSPAVAEEAAFTLPLMAEAPPAVPPKETGGSGLELKAEPFDELLFSTGPREASRSVPDMDLPGASSFYASDWESLGTGTSGELEPLCTPVVTCTPCPSTYTSTFVFTYPEADAFPSCAAAHRKGSSSNEPSSDSLSSPTLLAL